MKKFLLLMFIVFTSVSSMIAQKTINGVVTDEEGDPLIGANVVVVDNESIGTSTDIDGTYSLSVPDDALLIEVSYTGYTSEVVSILGGSTFDVTLIEGNVLEDVVVVGYGTTTKKAFTGSAKIVKAEVLEAKNVANVTQALAGESAGVTVLNTSGQPGTTSTVRIRGFGSVNGNRAPLYVVDGVPFEGDISAINPGDIESTTILKDATATAIYGSRGANGVILINTKKGKAGQSNIVVDYKTGYNYRGLPRYETITDPDEFISVAWNAMKNNAEAAGEEDPVAYANENLFSGRGINAKYNMYDVESVADLIDPATGKVREGVKRKYTPENWADYGFQQSTRNEANLQFNGGNGDTRYFTSFGYLNDQGIITNSDYKRYSARINLEHKPKSWLTTGFNLGYTYGVTKSNGQSSDSGSVFWFTDNIPSIYPLFERDENGEIIADEIYKGNNVFDYGIGRGFGALTNSIADATYNLNRSKRNSLNGNFFGRFDLYKGLQFETRYGAQYYSFVNDDIRNPFYGSAAGASTQGRLFKQNRNLLTQSFLNMLSYKTTFGEAHNFDAKVAHETFQYKRERNFIDVKRVVNLENGLDQPSNYVESAGKPTGWIEDYNIESYFGQLNYNYNYKYYVSGSVRRDGSSRFYKNKWGTFGSVGLGWVLTEENFLKDNSIVNYLKLKTSYGLIGDQNIGFYEGQNGYNVGNLGGQISLAVRPIQNPDITWETAKTFQTGVEFALFDNILEGSVDFYNKVTDDLFFDRRIGPSVGDALIKVNDGKLRNAGVELELNAHLINKDNFKLDLGFNGEFLKNELTQMPIDPATGEQKFIDVAGAYGRANGHSLFDFYVPKWTGVDATDGAPTWSVFYQDNNGNGEFDAEDTAVNSLFDFQQKNPDTELLEATTKNYSEATSQYIGKSAIPTIRGAFRLSADIYKFTVSTQFLYSLGGHSYDYTYARLMHNDQIGNNNYHVDILNAWTQEGDVTEVPRSYSNQNINVRSRSSRYITSSDYLALNNIRVGYALPSNLLNKINVKGVNVWVSGDNLMLLSAREGFNPISSENGESDTYRYTPLSTISGGVRFTF